MSFQRTAATSGFILVILLVINGVLLGNVPLAGDDIDEIEDYVTNDVGLHKTALFIGVIVLPFAIAFFAGVFHLLKNSDQERNETWAAAALASAILVAASAGIGDTLYAALIFRGGDGLDPSATRALYDIQAVAYASVGIALTALALSVAIPTLMHGILPSWYGILGLVIAALGVLSTFGMVLDSNTGSFLGGTAFVSFGVWALVTSVLMYRQERV